MREAFVKRRDQLPGLLNSRGLTGVGVEVGVQRGAYSETILAGSRLAELILVDPWREFADYQDIANVAQAAHDRILVEARTRLGRFGRRANFLRTTSLEGATEIVDQNVASRRPPPATAAVVTLPSGIALTSDAKVWQCAAGGTVASAVPYAM